MVRPDKEDTMRIPLSLITLALTLAMAVTAGSALAGRLDPDEMAAKKAEMFAAADADQNGALSFAEFEQLAEQHRAARTQRRFDGADADGDGLVTAEEFQAAGPGRGGCRHGDRP
jgi:Ca2+-binding EF-hand superfamily protein